MFVCGEDGEGFVHREEEISKEDAERGLPRGDVQTEHRTAPVCWKPMKCSVDFDGS